MAAANQPTSQEMSAPPRVLTSGPVKSGWDTNGHSAASPAV